MTQIDVEMLENVTGGRLNFNFINSGWFRWTGLAGSTTYVTKKTYDYSQQPPVDGDGSKKKDK